MPLQKFFPATRNFLALLIALQFACFAFAAPEVMNVTPSGGHISGTHDIGFYVRDASETQLWASIYYSSTKGAFSIEILSDANLFDTGIFSCENHDFTESTYCSYAWDTDPVTDGDYYIDVNVYNEAGLFDTESSEESFMIDSIPPITTDNAPVGWQETGFTVTLTCVDEQSGCDETYYRVNMGDWQTGNTVSISSDGNHQIDYYSVNNAGVEEGINTCYAALRIGEHTFTVALNLGNEYRDYFLYVSDAIDGTLVENVASQNITIGTNFDFSGFEKDGSLFGLVSTGAAHELDIANVGGDFLLDVRHSYRPNYGEEFFFVFTEGSHYDLEKNRLAFTTGDFLRRVSPAFGRAAEGVYRLLIGLDYFGSTINIDSDLSLGRGNHTLIMENQGVSDGRVVISITRS